MIPFLASTMFQNQLTSNWGRNDETKVDKKDYLKLLKFKPMLVKVNASHILADFKPQLINLSMVKEVRQGWSNLEDGTTKENWCQIDFIDGSGLYIKGNIDSFLYNDKLDSTLKNVLGDANPLVHEIRSHFVTNEEADENAGYKSKGVTQAVLDLVELLGEASYKEMNTFYRNRFGSNSFSHILKALIIPYKNRRTRRYLVKVGNVYQVRIADESNWIIK